MKKNGTGKYNAPLCAWKVKQSEHSMNNAKLPKFYLHVKESTLYNLLICMIISVKSFFGMEKPMKTLKFNHRSEIENK